MSKLKPSVSSKPPSRKTPFQPVHAIQYGLAVVMRDTHGLVCCVRCQMASSFCLSRISIRLLIVLYESSISRFRSKSAAIFQPKQFDQLNKR
ncbi:hypothetical protein PHMEG_00029438 [Phytophthora megakarya]|uniref:Uncharacterized protein n=1 Tax=Phytophthora megakarya TaxID=4795 RepID=A0A225V368_9STRA|nr:hypothetical protein PHMEG_00029438 [Phytophthora megakarya]